jgi:hypothetical protein
MLEDNKKIIAKKEVKIALYRDQFDEYVSASKKEKNVAQEYQGRELLELIQNAEDEAENRKGYIKICLRDNILTIQNSGNPFSYEGVLSLMTANYSVKDSTKYIGNKGLGFRAVLGWSKKISIFSEKLSVSFSREDARIAQYELEKSVKNPSLYQFDKYPIPIFSAPNTDIEYIEPEKGMDTLIILECKEDALTRDNGIVSQLRSINGKELLFLKNTGKVEINLNEDYRKSLEIIDEEYTNIAQSAIYAKSSLVSIDCSQIHEYRIYQQEGEIRFRNLDDDEETKSYLLSLAIPIDHAPIEKRLYSFFRTNVESPFNFVFNATLDLTQNRNNLVPSVDSSDFNSQVIGLMPDFIIESVKDHLKTSKVIGYELIKLLLNKDDKFLSIDGYDFHTLYISRLKSLKIFPSVNNQYIAHKDRPVLYVDRSFSKILSGPEFDNLLKWTDDDEVISFYKYLGSYQYILDSFATKINNVVNHLSIEDKAELIVALVDTYRQEANSTSKYPFLLVDSENRLIDYRELKIYNKPQDSEISKLPLIVSKRLRFVHKKLFDEIGKIITFNTSNKIRETIDRYLRFFGVSEYSFKALEPTINHMLEINITESQAIEVLKWVFSLYRSQTKDELESIRIRVKLPCTDGALYKSSSIYFGEEYGNNFYAQLLRNASPNFKFLRNHEYLNLEDYEIDNLVGFFSWLGVNHRPRKVKHTLDHNNLQEMKNYIRDCVTHYAKDEILHDYRIDNDSISLHSYDGFQDIINKTEFNHLVIWLMDEYNAQDSLIFLNYELHGAVMTATWPYNVEKRIYPSSLRSYVRWKLQTTKWIKVKGEEERKQPNQCIFDNLDIAPFMYQPDVDYAFLKQYNEEYRRIEVSKFFSELNVAPSLNELPYRKFYRLLSELPRIDPNFIVTRKIYDILIKKVKEDNNDYSVFINTNEYESFKEEGRVLSKRGRNLEFSSVNKTFYSDKKDLCSGILDNLNILDVARREGQEKISTIFGTQVFKNTKVEIISFKKHQIDRDFKRKFEDIKPYIALSRSLDFPNRIISEIKNAKVTIVSYIKIRYSLNNESDKEYVLSDYENIYSRGSGEAYISVPESQNDPNLIYGKYDFYESFAELLTVVFDVVKDKDVYKNLIRDSLSISKRSILDCYGDKGHDLIDEAKKKLGMAVTHKDNFWNIVEKTTANKDIELQNDYSELNYKNINAEINFQLIIKLFRELNIDISLFNANSNGNPTIHLEDFFIKDIRMRLAAIQGKYETYLYSKIDHQNIKNKCIEFKKTMDEYDFLFQKIDKNRLNTIHVNIENEVVKVLGLRDMSELNNLTEINIQSVQKKNISKYSSENKNKHESLLKTFDNEQISLYATFNELDILYDQISIKPPPSITSSSSKPEYQGLNKDDVQEKANVDLKGKNSDIERKPPRPSNGGKTPGDSQSERVSSQKLQDNGCIAEQFVYNRLKKENYAVQWISENGHVMLNSSTVDDSIGYDMVYIDENNDERYVEVKSSQSNQIKIKISRNEVKKGLENPKKYDIHFVNLDEEQRPFEYRIFKNIFDFPEGEDFFSNSKFYVDTDNYEIRAAEKSNVLK